MLSKRMKVSFFIKVIIQLKSIYKLIQMLNTVYKRTKKIVSECDLFRTSQLLRYKRNPEYKSVNGGICSIAIVISFTILFTQTIISTFNKSYISSQTSVFQQTEPKYFSTQDSPFLFALGISGFNINHPTIKYFNIQISQRYVINGVKSSKAFTLQPCDRSTWVSFNPLLGQPFDTIGLSNWLCLPSNASFQFTGKFTSNIFKYLKVSVKDCKATTGDNRTCVNSSFIDSFIASNGPISFNYYFVNTIINPDDIDYMKSYLEDRNFFTFTKNLGTSANLFISSFTIDSDESLWPWKERVEKIGGIVHQPVQRYVFNPTIIPNATQYISLYLRKSSLSLDITRSFKKYDDTLSYIGGLLSILMLCLAFMHKYNQYSFQIEVASKIYKYSQHRNVKSNQFNFVSLIGYCFYSILKFFNIEVDWKLMKHFSKVRQEIKRQLDLKLLFRKISFLQDCINSIFEDYEIQCLHLKGKMSLSQAENIRKKFESRRYLLRLKKKYENLASKQSQQNLQEHSQQINISNNKQVFDSSCLPKQLQNKIKIIGSRNEEQMQSSSDEQLQQDDEKGVLLSYIESINKLKQAASSGNVRCERIYQELDKTIKELPSINLSSDDSSHQEYQTQLKNQLLIEGKLAQE